MTHDELVAFYGSQAEAARQLDVSPQVVNAWKSRGSIPTGWQDAIELRTGGTLKRDRKNPRLDTIEPLLNDKEVRGAKAKAAA